jgi:hypothetical protein
MGNIPIFYSFARSGGTLVNQLLGVHPQCLVLSEVNPAASYKPIVNQAMEWLGLISAHEEGEFSNLPYHQKIVALYNRSSEQGKLLIIRDWVTANFLPGCVGNLLKPSRQLEQKLYLEHAGFELKPLVIARQSAAVYASIKHNFTHLRNLEIDVFAEAYLEYARAVTELPKIHMESLRSKPDATVIKILHWLGLHSGDAELILKTFHDFTNCTGNTTLHVSSKSSTARKVLPPETPEATVPLLAVVHPTLAEADKLLGYER